MLSNKSLTQLSAHFDIKSKSLPPVEQWNPPYCGEIDLQIKANGDWYYGGSIFKRLSLVKMFASVLIREISVDKGDEYFLVTPVEKVKINVEEQPFVLTQWQWIDEKKTIMQVSTNLDDEFILNDQHTLTLDDKDNLIVNVRRNLFAKVHRNVYYQWADLAKEKVTNSGTEMIFVSAGKEFSLGHV